MKLTIDLTDEQYKQLHTGIGFSVQEKEAKVKTCADFTLIELHF